MSNQKFTVQMSSEHISKNAKVSPKDAIIELIWNACDADATNVEIILVRTKALTIDIISEVVVKDNGHGIAYEEVEKILGYYGRSNKTYSDKSPSGRNYHGKQGHGRYKSFSIGSDVKWESIYEENNGKKYKFTITFSANNNTDYYRSEKELVPSYTATGLIVTITNVIQKLPVLNDIAKMRDEIISSMAAYILAYKDINLTYDGYEINPLEFIEDIKLDDLTVISTNGVERKAESKLILWKDGIGRDSYKIYLCGLNGIAYKESQMSTRIIYPISLYVLSDVFDELQETNLLDMGEINPIYKEILFLAKQKMREYINTKFRYDVVEEVRNVMDSSIYPYKGEQQSKIEVAERQTFDLLAVEINSIIPTLRESTDEAKKLTYRLIKEAVKNNPDSLTTILTEVFKLSPESQDKLASLLNHTTLASIISLTQTISNRLHFVRALEEMVYNNDVGKSIKERLQFHKILLSELWIFGEKYALGTSDVSLEKVLTSYLSHLHRAKLIPEIPPEAACDINLIPDLCLWNQYPIQDEKIENLVIELKRPTKILTKADLDQIDNYAYAIYDDKHFPKENTKWNFILLGCDFDSHVTNKLKDRKDGTANYYNSDDGVIAISVFRWNKVIQDNKLRFRFLEENLNFKLNDSQHSLRYLQSTYARYFQQQLGNTASQSSLDLEK